MVFKNLVVQLLSHVWLFVTPWTAARHVPLFFTISQSLLKFMSIESVMPSNCYVILCYFLLLLSSVFPSIKVFLMSQLFPSGGWSIGASALASVLSVNIQDWFSFRVGWFDLLAVQGTLKSLIQHHSLNVSVLQHSAFFMVQLSHPYMTTGKTTALTIQTFVGKVKSLLFNILSRFFITSLPKSKYLNFMAAVTISSDFGDKKIKSVTVSTFSPSICHKWWDRIPWSLFSECWVLSQLFHSALSPSSRGSLVPLHFLQ